MKYFSPSYWLKLWVLSAPLFNDKTQGINAKSIDNNQKIKDWVNKNTTSLSTLEKQQKQINELTNWKKDLQEENLNLNPISTHKHRHEKSRNRQHKRSSITFIGANEDISFSGVELNSKIYFGSGDGKVYQYDPITQQQKIVITATQWITTSGIVLNNKIYFGSVDGNVYEYDSITQQQKVAITATGTIRSGIVLNNKIYFNTKNDNVYEYDPITGQQKVVMTATGTTFNSENVLNNKLYFGSGDGKVYEYDPITQQQNIIITLTDTTFNSGTVFNNKIYFNINNGKVYEYDPELNFIFNTITLKNILNNSDKVILNILNYLNPNLDIEHLEISTKDNISATIKAKNNSGKYTGSTKIYYSINNNENKIINLIELIKQAIFFTFRDKKYNSFPGKIENINLENLIYSDIKLIKNSEIDKKKFFEYICSGTIELPILTHEQVYQSPSCEYSQEITRKYEIIKGITNTIGTQKEQSSTVGKEYTKEESTTTTTGNSKIETKNWNWNINTSFTSFTGFGFEGGFGGGEEESYTNENTLSKTTSSSNTLSKTTSSSNIITIGRGLDLSNTNTHEIKVTTKLIFPSQPIKVLENEQVKVNVVVNKTVAKVFSIIKQDIYGKINAVISSKNITDMTLNISIKELMQTLQKNNLLPPAITINDNDSITFNGEILLIETQNNLEFKLIREKINTTQIVKRDVEKWNISFVKTINQEQHLPVITNNTNSVNNNITSL